jgi:hypothetical protein
MFNHLFCNNVQIQKISGFDSYNNPITEEITIKGKLEFQIKNVTNINGDEVVSTGQLRLKEELSELDRINIKGVWREIINIIPQDDFSGKVQYYVIYF